jgi:protoheme IX farnesyltransferase
MKPRIIELLLVTTVPAMTLAAGGWPGTVSVVATLIGGALTAGAAHAYNMAIDRDIDAAMDRTRSRPLPAGRITVPRALGFATVLAVCGPALLAATAGWLATALAVAAMAFYVVVYTLLLKRRTAQNIVIGGAAGAAPPLIGWAAVTGELALSAWVLFAVVVLWTPPHFWALAIICRRDYESADVPMLPVVAGPKAAARHSLTYAFATALAALALPLVDPRVGWLYIAAAAVGGAWFVLVAARVVSDPQPGTARRLFTGSIGYLSLVFIALLVDQLVRQPGV